MDANERDSKFNELRCRDTLKAVFLSLKVIDRLSKSDPKEALKNLECTIEMIENYHPSLKE